MKRINLFLVMLLFLITGCWNNDAQDKEKVKNYKAYVDSVMKHGDEVSSNIPFDYNVEIVKLKNGTYRYDITIDNAKVAMYNVEVLAVDKENITTENDMFPNAGILDDDPIHMIPNQTNTDKGYHKGIVLSGISEKDTFKINVLVSFKDYAKLKQTRVYFTLDCKYEEESEA